jgi:glycosyltransferase involved in cell wall biosynthesis
VARVSVIIPAYNAEGHLEAALRSLREQRYGDWEAIVADDGSSDGTIAVAEASATPLLLVRSPVNRGLAATRNFALRHATGELVALLDSDDRWHPDYLERQVALYDAEQARAPGVGIVCCDADLVGPGGPLGATYAERFGAPSPPVDATVLLRGNPIFVSALIPRAVLDEVGGFDERLRSVEDLDLWLRIVERGYRVAYQPLALADYTIGAGTLSRDTLRMTRSRQAVYRAALERGRLDPDARRQAHAAIRLQRAAEIVELVRQQSRRRPVRAALAGLIAAPSIAWALLRREPETRSSRSRR